MHLLGSDAFEWVALAKTLMPVGLVMMAIYLYHHKAS